MKKSPPLVGITQAEFARLAGYARSRITGLKQDGRLVLHPDGSVDADASLARIAATADPSRAAVAERHAAARQNVRSGVGSAPSGSHHVQAEKDAHSPDYKHWQAVKMRADAERAEAERDELLRRLIPVDAADFAIGDLGAAFRTALELLPARVTPDIAHLDDPAAIEAVLVAACEDTLNQMQARLSQRAGELKEQK